MEFLNSDILNVRYFTFTIVFFPIFRFLHRKKTKMLILTLTLFWNGVRRNLWRKRTNWTLWENRTSDLSLWILNLKIRSTTLKAKISGTYILNSIYQKSYVVLKRSDHQFQVRNAKRSIFQTSWKPDCCPDFFVFRVRDFKFWLLAYFLIFFNYAKFQKAWTNLILDIL